MAEKIGLIAIFDDRDFTKNSERYLLSVKKMETETDKAASGIDKSTKGLGDGWADAAKKVGVAATAMGGILTAAATSVTLTAARTQELGVVLETVGRNIGLTASQMQAYETGVKGMGITTQSARQALIQMAQANIDLSKATDLARLAQDAAVIAQMDSSQALEQLITGTQRGSLVMLRQLGINVQFDKSYQEMAVSLGKATTALTDEERQLARVNTVLAAGENIAGTYEAAMGTAGKQMRSMTRHVQELANDFGSALLPAMSTGVTGATDFLKALRDLPDPIKSTIAQVTALSGGLLTVGGTATVIVPKIVGMVKALQTMSAAIGIGLGPLGLLVTALAAVGSAVIYLNNLEKAHREEAAAAAASAGTYRVYMTKLNESELSAYGLTRALYNLVKAQEASNQAAFAESLMRARDDLEGVSLVIDSTTGAIEKAGRGWERGTDWLSDFDLMVLQDYKSVALLGTELGKSGEELDSWTRSIVDAARATAEARQETEDYNRFEQERYNILHQTTQAQLESSQATDGAIQATGELADKTDFLTQRMVAAYDKQKIATAGTEAHKAAMEAAAKAADDYAAAIGRAMDQFASFTGTLASGIIELRDLDTEARTSTENYQQALRDLDAEAARSYGSVREKFEASLPDATTVQERMGMTADAWDEWGLRLQDIINDGVASPWYQALTEMGYEKPPDVGIKEWASDLRQQFYEGGLQDLINQDAAAWQEHASGVKSAQAEETAAVRQGIAERRAELEKARQEELAAQEEARQQATQEMALQLAEESGQLQQWAEQRLGAYAGVADSASEVLALLESGVLSLDDSLGAILTQNMAGLQASLDMTGQQAAENQAQLSALFTESQTLAQGIQTNVANMDATIQASEGLMGLLPPEDAALMQTNLDNVMTKVGELKSGLTEEDPFAALTSFFQGAMDAISAGVEEAAEAYDGMSEEMKEQASDTADYIIDQWVGHSVIPELITGLNDLLSAGQNTFSGLSTSASSTATSLEGLIQKLNKSKNEFQAISTKVKGLIADLAALQAAFNALDPPAWSQGDSPPPMATWMTEIANATLFAADAIGVDLAKAFINSTTELDDLFSAANSFSQIGGFFAGIFTERNIDPIAQRIKEIEDEQKRLEDLDPLSPHYQRQRNALEMERLNLLEQQRQEEEKILRLQEAQSNIKFLEQQFKLLELIKEQNLPTTILAGLKLGLGADPEAIMAAMTAALEEMIKAVEGQLGIGSPSRLFYEYGQAITDGLAMGIQSRSLEGATRAMVPGLPPPMVPVMRGGGDTSQTFNFGNNTINTPFDLAAMEARIIQAVTRTVRVG